VKTAVGYGAWLAGPEGLRAGPRIRDAALAVLRRRPSHHAASIHIDTSDYYGPHITNQLIREDR